MTIDDLNKLKEKLAWATEKGLIFFEHLNGLVYLKLRPMTISIRTITFGAGGGIISANKEWIPEEAPPFVVEAYVPLLPSGRAPFKAVRVTNGNLPHATKLGSCIYPHNIRGERIDSMDITTPDNYEKFCSLVERHFSGINLGSLACNYEAWRSEVVAFMPKKLRDLSERHNAQYAGAYAKSDKLPEEIANETWDSTRQPQLQLEDEEWEDQLR